MERTGEKQGAERSRLAGPTQKPPGGRSVDVLLGSDRPLWNLPFCSDTPAQGAHTLVGRHCDRVPSFPVKARQLETTLLAFPAMQDGWSGSHDHGVPQGLPLLHPQHSPRDGLWCLRFNYYGGLLAAQLRAQLAMCPPCVPQAPPFQ